MNVGLWPMIFELFGRESTRGSAQAGAPGIGVLSTAVAGTQSNQVLEKRGRSWRSPIATVV
jgi:hypothetical protein